MAYFMELKMIRHKRVPVVALNPSTGAFERIFESMTLAGEAVGCTPSAIRQAIARGDSHKCSYGYKWRKATQEDIERWMKFTCARCGVEGLNYSEMAKEPKGALGIRKVCKVCVAYYQQIAYHRRKANK